MREQLAQRLYESGASEEYFHALRTQDRPILDPERALADAIIAALPGMVKPLDFWVSDTGDLCCDSMIGRYQIQKGGARWCCMYALGNKRRPKGDDAPTYHRTEEAAKAAAQAHHVAQIMGEFGITVEDKA